MHIMAMEIDGPWHATHEPHGIAIHLEHGIIIWSLVCSKDPDFAKMKRNIYGLPG